MDAEFFFVMSFAIFKSGWLLEQANFEFFSLETYWKMAFQLIGFVPAKKLNYGEPRWNQEFCLGRPFVQNTQFWCFLLRHFTFFWIEDSEVFLNLSSKFLGSFLHPMDQIFNWRPSFLINPFHFLSGSPTLNLILNLRHFFGENWLFFWRIFTPKTVQNTLCHGFFH